MHNINEETAIITVKSLCSDDGKYRYKLTRTWDNRKKLQQLLGLILVKQHT